MSVITGEAVHAVRDMEDKEVVDECMKVLRELFKEQVTRVRVRVCPCPIPLTCIVFLPVQL